jgi:hypothetical protein
MGTGVRGGGTEGYRDGDERLNNAYSFGCLERVIVRVTSRVWKIKLILQSSIIIVGAPHSVVSLNGPCPICSWKKSKVDIMTEAVITDLNCSSMVREQSNLLSVLPSNQ